MAAPVYSHCLHFSKSLPRLDADETIEKFVQLLTRWEKDGQNYDTFAFCGLSGALIAPVLAHLLKKDLLMIRKNEGEDGSHSHRWVEGNVAAEKIIIVDDLIHTGATMKNILGGIIRDVPNAVVVGLLLYDHDDQTDLFLSGTPEFERIRRVEKDLSSHTKTVFAL
jgi:orotate phosphoribosyltransferase-like protein